MMWRRWLSCILMVALWLVARPAWPASKLWSGGNGNWSNGANWSPAGVPDNGDQVDIFFNDGQPHAVNYDYTGPAITLDTLIISTVGTSTALTFNMPGNALSATNQYLGYLGRATFAQSGGTNSASALDLGAFAGAEGIYNLSGSGSLASNLIQIIGQLGSGTVNQSGGTNTISGAGHHLYLGMEVGGNGSYLLSGGSLSAGENEYVGYRGTGNFDHSGGTNTVVGTLEIGTAVGATGAYSLSGSGQLVVNNQITVGELGAGAFNQSGGSNTASYLEIGGEFAALGTYNMSAGSLTTQFEGIGVFAIGNAVQSGGAFVQTGGTHQANQLSIANGLSPAGRSTGTYTLSGGSLVTSGVNIGPVGTGTFVQSGGVHANAQAVNLGSITGSSGSYLMSGGTTTTPSISVGHNSAGSGVLTVAGAGALLSVTNTIAVHNTPGTSLNLQSGTLNAGGIDLGGIPSLFNWTGGTLNITNDVTWDSVGASNPTGAIFGSSLSLSSGRTLKVTGNETIGGSGAFSLSIGSGRHEVTDILTLKPGGSISLTNASTLNYGLFTQVGGSISGFFRNLTSFTYQGGTISGQFVNNGSLNFGSSLSISGTLQNESAMTVATGQTLKATGGITNLGSFTLFGGTIGSDSPFTNAVGGTLTAHGIFNTGLVNHGTMIVDGVLTLTSSNTNDGILQGAGTVTNNSGSITNSAGGVISATNNGGTLVINALQSNNPGGVINVGPTSTLSLTNNWTNSGLVNLQGATARLSGGAITNNGTIQGFGTVTSSLAASKTGVIRASGGELVFTASGLTNTFPAQIQVLAGSTLMLLQGLSSNSGTISLTGGTFDNNVRTLTNLGTINGYGTVRTGGLTNSTGELLGVGEGNMDLFGTLTNNGVVNIQTGRSAYFYNNVNGAGSFTGAGTAVFLASLSPGNSPASVNFGGGVTLVGGNSLNMELGGAAPGSGYDQIHVAGQLSIGGILAVSLTSGFMPTVGSSFDLMDWGSLVGTFSSLDLPALSSGQWDASQLYTTGVLSVAAVALAGDYNQNGIVDAADYVLYRDTLGQTGAGLAADGNGNGAVDSGDYDVWTAHFGQTTGSGAGATANAAVPEPGAIVLTVIALMTMTTTAAARKSGKA